MDEQVNEYLLLITGLSNIDPSNLPKLGEDVKIEVVGNVLKVEDTDLQDGTTSRKFKIKQLGATIISHA